MCGTEISITYLFSSHFTYQTRLHAKPGLSCPNPCVLQQSLTQLLGTLRKHFLRNCTHCYLDIIEHLFYNMDTRTLEHLFVNMQAPFRSQPTGASGGDADGTHDPAL